MFKTNFSADAWQAARAQLKGAYDWHVHTGPSIFPRLADDRQTLAEADAAGMAGIGLKAHEGDTAPRARLLADQAQACKVFGGVTLNHYVGGLNPAAVEASLSMGGRMVWLPTLASEHHVNFYKRQGTAFLVGAFKHNAGDGIRVLGADGRLVPVMYDIFDLVQAKGAILSTGHLSPAEALTVARGFHKTKGDGRLVFGHPDVMLTKASLAEQQEFVRLGGYIEKCALCLHENWGNIPAEEFVADIRTLGLERCFISMDAGSVERPSLVDTLTRFVALVRDRQLLTDKELRILLVDVPQRLLGVA